MNLLKIQQLQKCFEINFLLLAQLDSTFYSESICRMEYEHRV